MTAPAAPPLVIVHRARFSPEETALLSDAGVRMQQGCSVAETLSEAEGARGRCIIVVSLSVGSNAPEQIFAGAAKLRDAGKSDVTLIATSPRGRNNDRRARKIGIDLVYSWPEGAFHEVVKLVSTAPSVVLRRISERAPVGQRIDDALGADARIVNISSTGAMIECDGDRANIEGLGLELSLGGAAQAPIFARVIWRETTGRRARLGIQFGEVSDATRTAIDRFVRETNVMRVGQSRRRPEPASGGRRVRVSRGTRRDYFQMEDTGAALLLTPKAPFFVPYQVGDEVDIVAERAAPIHARIVARRELDPDRIDSRIGWEVEPVQAGAASVRPTTLPAFDIGTMDADAVNAELTPPRRRDPRWMVLAKMVDAVAHGEDPFSDATHYVLVPAQAGSTLEFSARTFMMALQGSGSMLLFNEHDRVLALPPARDAPLAMVLGRDPGCDVVIDNSTVSKSHARMTWDPTAHVWSLEDIGSSNGTRIREDAFAAHEIEMLPGDKRTVQGVNVIRLGKQRLHIVSAAELRASCSDLLAKRLAAAKPR